MATEGNDVDTAADPWAQWQGVGHAQQAGAAGSDEQETAAQRDPLQTDGLQDSMNDPVPTTAETTTWNDSQWTPTGRGTRSWNWDSWSDSSWQWGTWWGNPGWSHCADPWSAARDQRTSGATWGDRAPQPDVGSQGSRDGDHGSNDGGSGGTDEPPLLSTRSGASTGPGGAEGPPAAPTTRPSATSTSTARADESGGPCLTAWYTGETPPSQSKGGLSERMAVPTFNAEGSGDALGLSARSYLRQLDAWCKITRAPANQRALLLYQSLGGRAWVEAEELSVEDLGTDEGVSILKAWIQERYQEVEVSKIAEALTQFFRKLRRQSNQTVREFNSAFDRAYARLLEIDCKLPEVAKAWVYLSALNLSNSEELSLLASVNNEYVTSKLQKAATLHEKSLQVPWRRWNPSGPPQGGGDRSRPTRGAYLTEVPEAGDEDYPDGDSAIPEEEAAELHEAFMAQEAAKSRYREISRARGFGQGGDGREDGKSASERLQLAKARSYCAGCKRRGHWHRDPECPLNGGKAPPSGDAGAGKKADAPKDAYVVHVAYEVGDWGEGLYAITDSACSRTVAGEGWLQQYLEATKKYGTREQLLPCSEDFRFGASKLFHANYTATIYIEINGKGFWVRAAIVAGDVPLLLSRSLLATLGMVFDLEKHRASFKNLGVDDIKLHYTVTGHPAVAVNPKGAANLSCPTPQQWGSQEVIMIEPTRQQYTVFMARASDSCQDAPLGHDHGRQQASNLPVLFPKKINDVIHNILTADVLSVSSFCTWWKQTRQSNDFWIETPKAFYRIHIVPRRAFFQPDKWRTPYVAQRDCLLAELGSVRSTWAVACMNYRGLEPAHDMWQHGALLSHDVLWIGRSVFARRPSHLPRSLDGIRLQEHMGHEQGRVDRGSLRSGAGVPLVVDYGGDSVSTTGASAGSQGGEPSEGIVVAQCGGPSRESWEPGHRPATKGDQRYDPPNDSRPAEPTWEAGRVLWPLQELPLRRGAPGISGVEYSRDQEQRECLRGPTTPRELRPEQALPGGGTGSPRSRGERHDPVLRGRGEELNVIENHLVDGEGEHEGLFQPDTSDSSGGEGQGEDRTPEPGAEDSRGGGPAETHGSRSAQGGIGGDQPVDDSACGAQGPVQHQGGQQLSDSGVITYPNDVPDDKDAFYDCFEENSERDPWPEAQVLEEAAKNARKNKDYREETIIKVIKELARFGEGDRHRQAVPTGGHIVVLGAYSYGAFHGVNQKTMKFPQCALYLNAWAKTKGFRGPWTSISVAVNVGHLLHRDPNNLPGSANQTIAVGNFSGGRLWLEKSNEDGATDYYETHDYENYEISTKEGKKIDGAYVSTKGHVRAFNPKRRHFVEDWCGERISLSVYTIRGVDQLNRHEEDFLRSLGFPRHGDPLRVLAYATPGPEDRNRPKKSVRKQIWKCAAQASALLATTIAASSSYGAEVAPELSSEHIALLEVGDYVKSIYAAELDVNIAEPIDPGFLFAKGGLERALKHVENCSPRVVWYHFDRNQKDLDYLEKIGEVQLREGRKLVVETNLSPGTIGYDHITNLFQKFLVKAIPSGYKYEVHVTNFADASDAHEAWAVDGGSQQIPTDEPSGASAITFTGSVSAPIRGALTRLHQNLGHPSVSDLTRHLRFAGADDKVIAACKGMRCQTCDRTKKVAAPRPASLPSFLDFNALVSVDVFHVFDAHRKRHELLSIIDHATTYHLVAVLSGHSNEAFEKGFVELWGRTFGAPRVIAADLESGLQKGLGRYTDFTGTKLRSKAGQAHWQQGVIERHGGWYKEILNRVIDEHTVYGEDIHLAVASVNAAKNELRRKHGFSPAQAVFGKDPACPEELLSGRDEEQYLELMTEDRKRQKEIAIRNAAKAAFFRTQVDNKFRRSLLQRARVKHGAYAVGQMACFFRIEKVATKRGQWRGPGLILGNESGNWWISHGGRCYLTAEEHMRPATAEEIGDLMNSRVARADLEKLLAGDQDDPSNYNPEEDGDGGGNVNNNVDAEDMDMDLQPEEPEQDDRAVPPQDPPSYGPVRQRVRTKKPQPHSVNILKKCLTDRSREKQYEKEIPWAMVPPEQHAAFKQAERKQLQEHYDLNAFTPLTKEQSDQVYAETPRDRILTSRWAYRDKNWSRRRQDASVEWRPKARLVVGGHLDPDIGEVKTDAPTISRLGLLTILQVVASHQRDEKPWTASAGDVSAAFLNGQPIKRLLYMKQPKTGFPDMEPGALLKIEKNIFGLVDSPREWWQEFRDTVLKKEIRHDGQGYRFKQSPVDSCMFFLYKTDDEKENPCAYLGVHVDDVLVAGEGDLAGSIRQGLSEVFPISDWEVNTFEFLGSRIRVQPDGVRIDQEHYTDTRLFEVPVQQTQNDFDPATEEQRIDNQSLVGALSWLGSQTRPDLVCGVSMAQQLQKSPTAGDVRFTNMLAKRAEAHRDKGIWLKPVDLNNYEIFVYHDSAWANASLDPEDDFTLNESDHNLGMMTGTPYDFKERKAKKANSKVASQYGLLILIADRNCFAKGGGESSLLEWRSAAGKRVCRSTFAAETMACCEGLEAGQFVRSFLATTLQGRLCRIEELYGHNLHCFSDCRSLYDHVHRQGLPRLPSDKRLAIDLAAIRQMMDQEQRGGRQLLHWVPTHVQLADILTKPMIADNWWRLMYDKLFLPLKETGE